MISPYTYRALIDARFNHQSAPADPRRVRGLLIVAFRVSRLARGGKSVELKAVHRVDAAGSVGTRSQRVQSPVSIDFIDANERIVASHHCFASRPHAGGDCCCDGPVSSGREPWLDFVEAIDWPADQAITRLQFNDGSELPNARSSRKRTAERRARKPHRVEAGWQLVIRAWPNDVTARSALLLFSNDDGQTWTPAQLDLPAVPRGLHLRLHPQDCAPHSVQLSALIDTRGLGGVAAQDVVWASNRARPSRGFQLSVRLSEGQHVITATIPDGLGRTLAERGIIIVGGRPRGELR